jgi:hypothetical protein
MENFHLVRNPSERSKGSSTPSRDRPESVMVLGKNLFSMKGKLKRQSSAGNSSSSSSLYSNDMPLENVPSAVPSANNRDSSFMPSLFNRRKHTREESLQRRLQISVPFNFQHVTHTDRDNAVDMEENSQMDAAGDMSSMPHQGAYGAPGPLRGIEARELHSRNYSTSSVHVRHESLSGSVSRPPLVPRHTAPAAGRRLIKHARSHDYLRASPPATAPQRPPRSPAESPSSSTTPPVPPPRHSSRISIRPDTLDAFVSTPLERPQTSGGFRRPQPFSISEDVEPPLPPATSHGYMPPADFDASPVLKEHRFSHAVTTPDDAAWPLAHGQAGYDAPLPDVPEEEEQQQNTAAARSRLSVASNRSSLRASQSAPMLRTLAQSQQAMTAVEEDADQIAIVTAPQATSTLQDYARPQLDAMPESWEDVIDYCYEHEAEAYCDYEWERPSMDEVRNDTTPPVQVAFADDELAEVRPINTALSSPGPSFTPRSDVPALSPSSQTSTILATEATTPATTPAVTSNFSLPRDKKIHRPSMLKTMRPASTASSFRESHGFTLSPSLLIPGDYHQQMLLSENERQHGATEQFTLPIHQRTPSDGVMSQNDKSSQMGEQRSSTSTNSTSRSGSTAERHTSANSDYTSLTRLTASSSASLNKMASLVNESMGRMPTPPVADAVDDEDTEQETTPPASQDTVPELQPFPSSAFARKAYHKSHASESIVQDEVPPMVSRDSIMPRRARARTSSLSAQAAPPVGQYALFPKTYIRATGDQI